MHIKIFIVRRSKQLTMQTLTGAMHAYIPIRISLCRLGEIEFILRVLHIGDLETRLNGLEQAGGIVVSLLIRKSAKQHYMKLAKYN